MADCDERQIGDLIVRIDRTLCVGFGDCVDGKEPAFSLADDGIAVFRQAESVTREALVRACESCPVDALSYKDVKDTGNYSASSLFVIAKEGLPRPSASQ